MAKSSGGTRASASSNPRGLNNSINPDRAEVILATLETSARNEGAVLENITIYARQLGSTNREVREYISSSGRVRELPVQIQETQDEINSLRDRVSRSYNMPYERARTTILNDTTNDNSILTFKSTIRNIEERETQLEGLKRRLDDARQKTLSFQNKYFK